LLKIGYARVSTDAQDLTVKGANESCRGLLPAGSGRIGDVAFSLRYVAFRALPPGARPA